MLKEWCQTYKFFYIEFRSKYLFLKHGFNSETGFEKVRWVYTHFRSFFSLVFSPETTLEKSLNIQIFSVFQASFLNKIFALKNQRNDWEWVYTFLLILFCNVCCATQADFALMEKISPKQWSKQLIFQKLSDGLKLYNPALSKQIKIYGRYTPAQMVVHKKEILLHLRLGVREFQTYMPSEYLSISTPTPPSTAKISVGVKKPFFLPRSAFKKQKESTSYTKQLASKLKEALQENQTRLILKTSLATKEKQTSTRKPSPYIFLLPQTSSKQNVTQALPIKIKQALAQPYLKHIHVQDGRVSVVSYAAQMNVALYKQCQDDFQPLYVTAFQRALFLLNQRDYQMQSKIHHRTRLAFGPDPITGVHTLRFLLDKPEKADRGQGDLSPFRYEDSLLWQGVFEVVYTIQPDTGQEDLYTVPHYKWVRPLYTYPDKNGFVSKDKIVYEIKEPYLQWKYLRNRTHRGETAKPLNTALSLAQKNIAKIILGPEEVFAEAHVTAVLIEDGYHVAFIFARQSLNHPDVRGVFPEGTMHGYEGHAIPLVSRDRSLVFNVVDGKVTIIPTT